MKILLITEQRDAKWNKVSFETLTAAQQIAQQTSGSVSAVVIGKNIAALAQGLSALQLDEHVRGNVIFGGAKPIAAHRQRIQADDVVARSKLRPEISMKRRRVAAGALSGGVAVDVKRNQSGSGSARRTYP